MVREVLRADARTINCGLQS